MGVMNRAPTGSAPVGARFIAPIRVSPVSPCLRTREGLGGGACLSASTLRVQRSLPLKGSQPDQQHPPSLLLVQVGTLDITDELAAHRRLIGDGIDVVR